MLLRCSDHLLWTVPRKGDEWRGRWVPLLETLWAYGLLELLLGYLSSELQLGCSSSELQLLIDDDPGQGRMRAHRTLACLMGPHPTLAFPMGPHPTLARLPLHFLVVLVTAACRLTCRPLECPMASPLPMGKRFQETLHMTRGLLCRIGKWVGASYFRLGKDVMVVV
jgi:hypothetical protein